MGCTYCPLPRAARRARGRLYISISLFLYIFSTIVSRGDATLPGDVVSYTVYVSPSDSLSLSHFLFPMDYCLELAGLLADLMQEQ